MGRLSEDRAGERTQEVGQIESNMGLRWTEKSHTLREVRHWVYLIQHYKS